MRLHSKLLHLTIAGRTTRSRRGEGGRAATDHCGLIDLRRAHTLHVVGVLVEMASGSSQFAWRRSCSFCGGGRSDWASLRISRAMGQALPRFGTICLCIILRVLCGAMRVTVRSVDCVVCIHRASEFIFHYLRGSLLDINYQFYTIDICASSKS